jgi:hypothetical protein
MVFSGKIQEDLSMKRTKSFKSKVKILESNYPSWAVIQPESGSLLSWYVIMAPTEYEFYPQ